jgi:hypothetical protein
MEINEKTRINLGFLTVILGGLGSFLVLYASTNADLTRVKEKADSIEKRVDRQGEYISKKVDQIDARLYEIQKMLFEMKRR